MDIEGYRLSPQQRRYWSRHKGAPLDAWITLGLSGALDAGRFQEALGELLARHEALATLFQQEPGMKTPLQVVTEEAELTWKVMEDDHPERAIAQLRDQAQSWDLAARAGLEATLIRVSDDDHRLLLRLPALHLDPISVDNLIAELAALYDGDEPEEAAQFLDFSEWQYELLDEETAAAGQAFWRRSGTAILRKLREEAVEGSKPRNFIPRRVSRPMDGLVLDDDRIMAGWAALHHRLEDRNPVTVEALFQKRPLEDLQEAVGLLAIAAPLEFNFEDDLSLQELTAKVAEQRAEAAAYLNYLPPELHEDRAEGLAFERLPKLQATQVGGLQITRDDLHLHHAPFRLKLSVIDTSRLDLWYDPAEIDQTQAEHLLESLHILLRAPADTAVSQLPLMGPSLRDKLVAQFNDTQADYPATTLHQLFEAQAVHTPDQIAVRADDDSLTFDQLNRLANRIAADLRALEAGPETRVALLLERGVQQVAAVLGVLKSGAAYIGMDTNNPRERLAKMSRHADLYLTRADLLPNLAMDDKPGLLLDPVNGPTSNDDTNPDVSVDPEHPAYVLFTSGSTGEPKGVVVPHRGVVNYLTWAGRVYPQDRGWGAPLHSSLNFDLTVTSLYLPLLGGRTVVLVPETDHFDELNKALVQEHRFSLLKMTPSHLKLLNQLDIQESIANASRGGEPARGTLVLGGEQLLGEDVAKWREQLPFVRIINEYGPTETVVGCAVHEVDQAAPGPVPIGAPIANTRLYVLDSGGRPTPASGELFIAGDGLARGYVSQPAITADRFLPDPFATKPGQRMYRTGDVVRFLGGAEPVLAFIGRVDLQVKVRGYRIELGEIEAALKTSPDVDDGVVLAIPDQTGESRLIAYVRPTGVENTGGAGTRLAQADAIQAHLTERLPEYMTPTTYVGIPEIPLTPNGKVDTARLPQPDHSRPDLAKAYVAPTTPTQEILAKAWAKALDVDQVGVRDNFFALGGDSIRSVSAVAAARALGVEHSVQTLFRFPNIEALAQAVDNNGLIDDADDPVGEVGGYETTEAFQLISEEDRERLPEDVIDAYPLSAVQLGMYFHMLETRDLPSPPAYHNVNTFKLKMPFHIDLFHEAVAAVVARHPILRTSFDLTNFSQPLQLIHREAQMDIRVEDIRHLSEQAQEAAIESFIQAENFRLIDVHNPPLMRFYFHQQEDDVVSFTLTEPHSISDGWSTHLTLVEMFQHYLTRVRGEATPDITPLPVTYRDFIHMELRAKASPAAKTYWTDLLNSCEPTRLPEQARAVGAEDSIHDHKHEFYVDADTLRGLHHLARMAGAPFKTVLLAAHLKVLSMFCGQDPVTTGLAFNGRPETPGGDDLRGLFLNTLPFPFHVSTGDYLDLVKRVYREETRMLAFRRYPIAALQSGRGREPLFTTLFSLHHFHSTTDLLADPMLEVLDAIDLSKTNYDIAVFFHISEVQQNHMSLTIEGNLDRLAREQLTSLYGYFDRVLRSMAARAEQPDRILMHQWDQTLPQNELRRLLEAPNRTAMTVDARLCLHHLFQAQAERTPDRLALEGDGLTMTYAELDTRTRELAGQLRELGVGPEVRVGVSLPRQPQQLVSLLAILQAGGAYVPLDPNNPPERLAYMLDDAGIHLVITTTAGVDAYAEARPQLHALAVTPDARWSQTDLDRIRAAATPARGEVQPENLAYMIYTSGSTGRPKAVAVHHAGVVNFMLAMAEHPGIQEDDRLLAVTNLSFDIACLELFLPLSVGATVVVASDELAADGAALGQALDQRNISVMQATPSTWRMISGSGWQGKADLRILSGGEPLPVDLATRLARDAAGLTNLYGPTETTIWSTRAQLEPDQPVHIGRAIENTQIYVIDQHFMPAPIGSPGELIIGGHGVTRGYHDRPDLTAQAFAPDPFSNTPGARLYRTGDRVYFRADGSLAFIGRIDFQVKLRGFRLEPGEIESRLREHDGVADALVMVREDTPGIKRLTAYLSLGDSVPEDTEPLVDDLRNRLRTNLPDYMVPGAFVFLERFPQLPSGKVNRHALPAPEQGADAGGAVYAPPENPLQEQLAAIWADVFGRERVGIHDNFFDLGGDSILSVLISARAEAAGLILNSAAMFNHQTIAGLAEHLEQSQTAGGAESGPAPLTHHQQHLLETPAFITFNLAPKRALQLDWLRGALERMTRRHAVLRLHLSRDGDQLHGHIPTGEEHPAPVVTDLTKLEAARQSEQRDIQTRAALDAFDPVQDPLIRVWLTRTGDDGLQELRILVHRALLDDTAIPLFLDHLRVAYELEERDQQRPLPGGGAGYLATATWLADDNAPTELADYWRELTPDRSSAGHGAPTQTLRRTLDVEQCNRLQRAGEAFSTTPAEAMLTALAHTTPSPILFRDTPRGFEHSPDLAGTLGHFTVDHPVVIQTSDHIGETLVAVKDRLRRHRAEHLQLDRLGAEAEDLRHLTGLAFELRCADSDTVVDDLFHTKINLPDEQPQTPRLRATWTHDQIDLEWSGDHDLETLADTFTTNLEQLIEHCLSDQSGGLTAADFLDVDLDDEGLADILDEYGD